MKNSGQLISDSKEANEIGSQLSNVSSDRPIEERAGVRGWILYDGECQFCVATARGFERFFNSRGFVSLPLQTPWVERRLGIIPGTPLEEMRVLTATGENYGGADAVLFLARQIWFLRPLAAIGKLPLLHSALNSAYRYIAARRACGGRCQIDLTTKISRNSGSPGWRVYAPLMALSLVALLVRPFADPWVFMWFMVGAIFLGSKWLTLQRAKQQGRQAPIRRQLAYLFLWGGMDARAFLGPARTKKPLQVVLPQLAAALTKIALGALLLFGVARHLGNDLLAGWSGMIGIIMIAHFGLFDLATIWWQMRGLTAPPIMNAPWKSARLSEFWGRRWNHAFQQLVIDTLFRPFAHSFGVVRATLATFFISGLIHELVISLPAGAGYGLPTAYFLLQGWGLIAQRTPIAGRLRFNNRVFTLFLLVAPVFVLVHPPFVRGVILPFMRAIGAL